MTFYQQNNLKTRIFTDKGSNKQAGFVVVALFALLLMFADCHYNYFHNVRHVFTFVISPLQYVVDYPVRVVGGIQSLMSAKKTLINENMRLHYRQTLLQAELQKLLALKEENTQLRELLFTSSKVKVKTMVAQILAVDATSSRQLVVLNKGNRDGVYLGQPVLDAKGVIGQILDVGRMTSTVLLVSDSQSAVPVRNNRTGEQAILVGTNNIGQLSLINLPRTSSIKKGDVLVTSGLGHLYPEGYPVGEVEAIKNIPGEPFLKVDVTPIGLLNRARLVLLLKADKEQTALASEIKERLNVSGEKA